jgi:hypothetical protein|tara:strand:- start:133 stop:1155 length:1023 start_codon:yes stop_codon:yes gene_type:complete
MKKYIIIFSHIIFYTCYSVSAQQLSVTTLTTLGTVVNESSGLIFLNGRIITHNDADNLPILYEIDSISSMINREVVIMNAKNIDWEDICFDDTYIYIADIGNNYNNRTDLKIYKISIYDYLYTSSDTVVADSILFSYTNQVDFSYSPNQTNFDAETLISYNDSLYIFTKNYLNQHTDIYSVPKQVGNYQITKIDSFNSQGLITGGHFNINTGEIILTGYALSFPFITFITKLSQFNTNKFSSGIIDREIINIQGSPQIEAITAINNSTYLITSEENPIGDAMLYKIQYFNPTKANELVKSPKREYVTLIDLLGRKTQSKKNRTLFYIYSNGAIEKKIIVE